MMFYARVLLDHQPACKQQQARWRAWFKDR
jgi:hypothetical protein